MVILIARKKGPDALNATQKKSALYKIAFLKTKKKIPKMQFKKNYLFLTGTCILHTSHCALHSSHYTLHTTQYTLHAAHYTLHLTTHCTLNTVDALPGGERDTEWVQQPSGQSGQ